MHKILAFFLLCFAACSIDGGTVPDVGMTLASDGGAIDGGISMSDGGSTGNRVIVPQFRVGSAMLAQPAFFDRTLSTSCYPRKTTAGLRCIPADVNLIFYTDVSCTIRGGLAIACQTPTYGAVADMPDNVCDQGNYHTFRLRKLTQANYYSKSGAVCLGTAIPSAFTLYAADTEIDPATFAEAVEVR